MLNKWQKYLESIGLSFKKEVLIISLSNGAIIIAFILSLIFFKQMFISLSIGLLLFAVDAYMYLRYTNRKKEIKQQHEDEFVTIISYFQMFLSNGNNVYQSFQKCLGYSSEWMQEKIQLFLYAIDQDKTVTPFVEFAKNFQHASANNIMLSIYQMVDEGENGAHMLQFSIIFDQIAQAQHQARIDRKEKSLSGLSTFPLIGAGLITVVITFSVIILMGDMINVL